MTTKLKSQINLGSFLGFGFLYLIICVLVWTFYESHYAKIIILIIAPFYFYLSLALWVNRFYFYADNVIIKYFFRLQNRTKTYKYSEINNIKYMNNGGKGNQPMIIFLYKGQHFSKLFKPSNSFTHRSFKKRKEILKFLASKDIPIEINSVFKKDEEILL